MNFHFDVFARMGYEAEATKIQELYLEGHKDEAAAAVPTALIEDTALIGPRRRSGTTSRGGRSPSPPPCWCRAARTPSRPWRSWCCRQGLVKAGRGIRLWRSRSAAG